MTTTVHQPSATDPTEPEGAGFSLGAFLGFRYLITPVLVQAIYVIVAAVITIAGLVALVAPGPNSGVIPGLLIIVIGNLAWRVYMEIVMLFFRINAGIAEVARNTRRGPPA